MMLSVIMKVIYSYQSENEHVFEAYRALLVAHVAAIEEGFISLVVDSLQKDLSDIALRSRWVGKESSWGH